MQGYVGQASQVAGKIWAVNSRACRLAVQLYPQELLELAEYLSRKPYLLVGGAQRCPTSIEPDSEEFDVVEMQ